MGTRYTGRKLHAELIGFLNDYQNLTSTCTFSTGCADNMIDVTFSAGAARYFGFEALVEHEIAVGVVSVPFQASYTFTHAEFGSAFTSDRPSWGQVQKGDQVPYIPSHQLNASAGVEHKRGGANVALSYQAATRESPGTDPISQVLHTDAQLTVDLSARYQLFDGVQLYANVRNLFDSAYVVSHRPFGARPNAPRWIQVGAKFDL
jgi:Fe(3+) dicitrate transport protein